MKVPSTIKWTKSDYIKLGKAIADFNKKISKLENKDYLPQKLNYKEIKENLLTRQELNNFIKSTRRFLVEGAENLYITKAGERTTQWERKELQYKTAIITRRINTRIKELNTVKQGQEYSRIQMGSIEFRELQAKQRKINSLEQREGYRFLELKEQIHKQGRADYEYKKQYIFKENYLEVLKRYSHFDNYNELINFINENLSNPKKFYEYVSDIDIVGDLTLQSDQYYSQMMFNSFVQDFGVEIKIDSIS